MTTRTGIYIVPTHRWYIERTVWLIAGIVLLGSTLLAALVNPLWILGVAATGLVFDQRRLHRLLPHRQHSSAIGISAHARLESADAPEPLLPAN